MNLSGSMSAEQLTEYLTETYGLRMQYNTCKMIKTMKVTQMMCIMLKI